MPTLIQTYGSQQTDATILTPASGKKLYLWQVICDFAGGLALEFITSAITVTDQPGGGQIGIMNPDKTGAVDEVLSLSCGAGTTVKILYDEI